MADMSKPGFSRRSLMRGAAVTVCTLGVALTAPNAVAEPPEQCNEPSGVVENCPVELPEEFSAASFSTTSVANGTNYSILFSTKISPGPHVPDADGYEIDSTNIAGTLHDGAPFSVMPEIGEHGQRALNTPSGSSLGFVLDHVWNANNLVRSFDYTYDVVFRKGAADVQKCSYVTTMTLADNGQTSGGVDSVAFSPPRLTSCPG